MHGAAAVPRSVTAHTHTENTAQYTQLKGSEGKELVNIIYSAVYLVLLWFRKYLVLVIVLGISLFLTVWGPVTLKAVGVTFES